MTSARFIRRHKASLTALFFGLAASLTGPAASFAQEPGSQINTSQIQQILEAYRDSQENEDGDQSSREQHAREQSAPVARGGQPAREGAARIDPDFFLETPPHIGVSKSQDIFESLICENNTQTGCFVELGKPDKHDRCRKDFIRVFGDQGVEYRIDMNDVLMMPVRQEAMRARRRVGAETSTAIRSVEGSPIAAQVPQDVVKHAEFRVRWECATYEENQQSDSYTAAADFLLVNNFASYIYMTPYLWRPAATEIGNPEQGEYVKYYSSRDVIITGKKCSKDDVTIYGKNGREIRLRQGVRQLVEVNSSRTNTQARWECGDYVENRTIEFPKGTDALDVHFTTKDANAFGDAKRVDIAPVFWRSFWREPTETERAEAEQAAQEQRVANMIRMANENNIGVQAIQAANAAEGRGACYTAIQNRIAWDYAGNKTWNDANIQSLCKDVPTAKPAECFNMALHGRVARADGSDWNWQDGIALCQGATNPTSRIACFEQESSKGVSPQRAIEVCNPD